MKTTSNLFRLFAILLAVSLTFATSNIALAGDEEDDDVTVEETGTPVPASTEVAEEETPPQSEDAQVSTEKEEEEGGFSVEGDVTVSTMNVDTMSGEKLSSRITIAPTIIVSYGELYVSGTVTAEDFDRNFSHSTANAIEVSAGMEKEFAGITFDAGVSFSDTQGSAEDFWCIYLNAEMKELTVVPYVKVEMAIPTKKEVTEGDFLYRVGGKYSWNDVLFDLSLAGHDGAYGYKPQALSSGLLSVSREFILWGQKLTPSVNVQKTFDTDGIAEDLVWIGVKFAF